LEDDVFRRAILNEEKTADTLRHRKMAAVAAAAFGNSSSSMGMTQPLLLSSCSLENPQQQQDPWLVNGRRYQVEMLPHRIRHVNEPTTTTKDGNDDDDSPVEKTRILQFQLQQQPPPVGDGDDSATATASTGWSLTGQCFVATTTAMNLIPLGTIREGYLKAVVTNGTKNNDDAAAAAKQELYWVMEMHDSRPPQSSSPHYILSHGHVSLPTTTTTATTTTSDVEAASPTSNQRLLLLLEAEWLSSNGDRGRFGPHMITLVPPPLNNNNNTPPTTAVYTSVPLWKQWVHKMAIINPIRPWPRRQAATAHKKDDSERT
jgi:hypothetical protein